MRTLEGPARRWAPNGLRLRRFPAADKDDPAGPWTPLARHGRGTAGEHKPGPAGSGPKGVTSRGRVNRAGWMRTAPCGLNEQLYNLVKDGMW